MPAGSTSTTCCATQGGGGSGGLGDIFGGLFNRNATNTRAARAKRGSDVETEVRISFAEAVSGVTVPLRLAERSTCPTCLGTGAKPGTSAHDCPVCNGTGLTTRNQGSFAFSEPCTNCHGTGSIIDDPCPTCHGERTVLSSRTLSTRIPAGVADGQRIRLAGKGDAGTGGGPRGDLFVVVHVSSARVVRPQRRQPDAHGAGDVPGTGAGNHVDRADADRLGAACGSRPGTASGRKLRVKGAGVKRKDVTGDLIVTVEVAVPQKLSAEATEALEAFAAAQTDDPRPAITRALKAAQASS